MFAYCNVFLPVCFVADQDPAAVRDRVSQADLPELPR